MGSSKRVFVVSCAGCRRVLLTVDRIRDAETARLREHLRACFQEEPSRGGGGLGEIMDRLRVVVKEGE
jgi:hypothetical protein